MTILCGIPSVTLLGEKIDYEKILHKIERLDTFGDEAAQFGQVLKPIIRRMINTFDHPFNQDTLNFWRAIVDVNHFSGISDYSGWITAFMFWDEKGRCLHRLPVQSPEASHHRSTQPPLQHDDLVLDGIHFQRLRVDKIPSGWCQVPVTLDDNGKVFNTEMIAGSIGTACSSSGVETESGDIGLDTMQPVTAWFIYEPREPHCKFEDWCSNAVVTDKDAADLLDFPAMLNPLE